MNAFFTDVINLASLLTGCVAGSWGEFLGGEDIGGGGGDGFFVDVDVDVKLSFSGNGLVFLNFSTSIFLSSVLRIGTGFKLDSKLRGNVDEFNIDDERFVLGCPGNCLLTIFASGRFVVL